MWTVRSGLDTSVSELQVRHSKTHQPPKTYPLTSQTTQAPRLPGTRNLNDLNSLGKFLKDYRKRKEDFLAVLTVCRLLEDWRTGAEWSSRGRLQGVNDWTRKQN